MALGVTTLKVRLDKDDVDRGLNALEKTVVNTGKTFGIVAKTLSDMFVIGAGELGGMIKDAAKEFASAVIQQSERLTGISDKIKGVGADFIAAIGKGIDEGLAGNVTAFEKIVEAFREKVVNFGKIIGVSISEAMLGDTSMIEETFSIMGEIAWRSFRKGFRRVMDPGRDMGEFVGQVFPGVGEIITRETARQQPEYKIFNEELLKRIADQQARANAILEEINRKTGSTELNYGGG